MDKLYTPRDQDLIAELAQMPFGMRVRTLRVFAQLTQDELADRVSSTKATISKIERSTSTPKMEWVEKLAGALRVSESLLLFGREDGAPAPSPSIPVIGMIAAGNWREAIQQPLMHIDAPGAKKHMFALKVDGDSIDRVAPDGSYVTIDPTNPSLAENGLYAVQNGDGEATIKRFRRNPDRLEPDSTNPIHQPIMLGKEPVTIIGRATSVTWVL